MPNDYRACCYLPTAIGLKLEAIAVANNESVSQLIKRIIMSQLHEEASKVFRLENAISSLIAKQLLPPELITELQALKNIIEVSPDE
jgi:hypothetical protein